MTSKYPVWACTLALIVGACTAAVPAPSASPTAVASAPASPSPTARTLGAAVRVIAVTTDRRWYTVPDGLAHDRARVSVEFEGDPTGGSPRLVLPGAGREVALAPDGAPTRWSAEIDLAGLAPNTYALAVGLRVAGTDTLQPDARWELRVSAPEYVVWTLDFEGDEASAAALANTAAIADGLGVPMTVMWNPRAWTSSAVSPAAADAMLAWTKGRAAKGDEVALHLHMYTDYVRAAGVAPKSRPAWSGRLDGYDVPMTAYSEDEQRALIAYGLRLMADHGLAGVTSFRAGGLFADAATLRAAAANGMTADCSATAAGTFGSLRLPWTLAADAQPYRPSKDDANRTGDLPLLEAPTNGGNTYGYTVTSIAPIVRAGLAMLARPGEVATVRKGITIVSHPATIDATERAAIETLLHAFDAYRYDNDKGPLRFVTLRELARVSR